MSGPFETGARRRTREMVLFLAGLEDKSPFERDCCEAELIGFFVEGRFPPGLDEQSETEPCFIA